MPPGENSLSHSGCGLRTRDVTEIPQQSLSLFDASSSSSRPVMPKFDISELRLGEVLGEGEFGIVHEICRIKLRKRFSSRRKKSEERRLYMEANYLRGEEGYARYAVKKFHPEVVAEVEEEFEEKRYEPNSSLTASQPQMDVLAVEAALLSVMSHPNIIKMRGISNENPLSMDFFIVLDCLSHTLEERVHDHWKEQKRKWELMQRKKNRKKKSTGGGGLFSKLLKKKGKEKANGDSTVSNGDTQEWDEGGEQMFIEQSYVAYDICSALRYMHRHNIIYRDLKPQNIGFDVRNDVKLFDFGLSRELPLKDMTEEGLYKMTGQTGSRRYMAPEVALNRPYNLSSDVYSYGLILYEIMTLNLPFKDMTSDAHMEIVVMGGERPVVPDDCIFVAGDLLKIITSCWNENYQKRPHLDLISEIVRAGADAYMDGKKAPTYKPSKGNSSKVQSTSSVTKDEDKSKRGRKNDLSRSEGLRRLSRSSYGDKMMSTLLVEDLEEVKKMDELENADDDESTSK